MRLKVASWNINSVCARLGRLTSWLESERPDIVCLQELKVADPDFPKADVAALGYHSVTHGQRTYNGVAILARDEIELDARGLGDGVQDLQARLVSGYVSGLRVVCVYVPNGGEVGSDKWDYKLQWLARLKRWLEAHVDPLEPLVLCGDFNVAPEARDVCDPVAWEKTVLYHPQARAALAEVTAFGLQDTLRLHRQEPGLYSWWDYRMLAFPKNQGLRIDFVFATSPLAASCSAAGIDRNQRKGQQPSDHAPVWAEFSA